MRVNNRFSLLFGLWAISHAALGYAQAIPGAADAARVDGREKTSMPPSQLKPSTRPLTVLPTVAAPQQSENIHMHLQRVVITGMEAFSEREVADIYKDYLGKDITLNTAWAMVAKLSERYQSHGYFLSRAYIPQQQITKDGVLTIAVVEGYIAEVKLDDSLANDALVATWMERVKRQVPLSSTYLESVLLQLNDIPGMAVRATLEPVNQGVYVDGAVRLILTREATGTHGSVSFDNHGSKYLGPYEMSTQLDTVLLDHQLTSVRFLNAFPWDELKYGTVKQRIPVAPGSYAEIYGGYTDSTPGATLKISEVQSNSLSFGTSISYQWIRQRQENLSSKLMLETRDTATDILSTPQTRDHIRALRANLNYERLDRWQGYNQLNFTISQGLGILNSSEAGDDHLSRPEAKPWFQKAEFTYARSQALSQDVGIVTAASGQIASGPLYSPEEFGYGGQAFGRAFDSSEITGDHGIAGSLEFRYLSIAPVWGIAPLPYLFYDGGAVFNNDRTQEKTQAGMSTGAGLRFNSDFGANANLAVAVPVDKAVSNPIYGGSRHAPRYTMELSYGF